MCLMDKFNISEFKPHLRYHVAFSIDVFHGGKTIEWMIIDEGVKIVVPFRYSSNESNIIVAIKGEWIYTLNKTNHTGKRWL